MLGDCELLGERLGELELLAEGDCDDDGLRLGDCEELGERDGLLLLEGLRLGELLDDAEGD